LRGQLPDETKPDNKHAGTKLLISLADAVHGNRTERHI
jgi:hypothetical protein